jgi:hypothetical protein
VKKNILLFAVITCVLHFCSQTAQAQILELTNSFKIKNCFICQISKYYKLKTSKKIKSLAALNLNDCNDDDEQFSVDLFICDMDKENDGHTLTYFNKHVGKYFEPNVFHIYKNAFILHLIDIFWLGKNKYI